MCSTICPPHLNDFSVFPCITVPIRESFKPKIMKSSKKTRKIRKFIKETPSTQVQVYESDTEVIKPRGLTKNNSKLLTEDSLILKKKSSLDNEVVPKKMKELSHSLQIMSVFFIIMKIHAILVKRASNISKALALRDFRGVWRQIMLICTEMVKYLKDLTMKAKIVKSNDAKSLALLTESFYKSMKIYENMSKKKKSLTGLLWKMGKFLASLVKILINFDYIFPLEVLFPSNYLLILAFGFKSIGILRKFIRLIKASCKRPKRRLILIVKMIIVVIKMLAAVLLVLEAKNLIFYMISTQVFLHFVIFCFSVKDLISNWVRKSQKKKEKIVEIPILNEKKGKFSEEKEEGAKKMLLSRRILETRMGKEEICI